MLKLDESIRFIERQSVDILVKIEQEKREMTPEEQERYSKFNETSAILRAMKSALWSLDNTAHIVKDITR